MPPVAATFCNRAWKLPRSSSIDVGEENRVSAALMFCGLSRFSQVTLVLSWASNAESAASALVRGLLSAKAGS